MVHDIVGNRTGLISPAKRTTDGTPLAAADLPMSCPDESTENITRRVGNNPQTIVSSRLPIDDKDTPNASDGY